MWPEWSAWTWWGIAFLGATALAADTYRPKVLFARGLDSFDMPVQGALNHLIETVPHSFDSSGKAERHFFRALHEQMCAGKLPVIGSKGEGTPPERVSARRCRKLTPQEVAVPANPSALTA